MAAKAQSLLPRVLGVASKQHCAIVKPGPLSTAYIVPCISFSHRIAAEEGALSPKRVAGTRLLGGAPCIASVHSDDTNNSVECREAAESSQLHGTAIGRTVRHAWQPEASCWLLPARKAP